MNNSQTLFSILIASYNNGRFIQDAFNSIYEQSYTNWEVIIVDDGSTDDSVNLIKKASDNNTQIKLFQNDRNRGVGYTKYRCAELASGEIMGFLDPDDQLTADALENVVNLHLQNSNASMVYSNCYICETDLSIRNEKKVEAPPKRKSFLDCFDNPKVSTCHFTSFKSNSYNQTPKMNPDCKRAIDMDLYYKLEEVGEVIHIDKPLYKYRMHEMGLSLGSSSVKANAWHIYVIIETCKRRGLEFENYIPQLLERDIVGRERLKRDYKVGKSILTPFRYLKRILNKR